MKYLDEEDKEKLRELGVKILQAKKLTQEITEFFITTANDSELSHAKYVGTEEWLSIIQLYIKGESLDYISEQVLQSDGTAIRELLKMMNIEEK